MAAAFDYDGYWSCGNAWRTGIVQKNQPALAALNDRWDSFGFPLGRIEKHPYLVNGVATCNYELIWSGQNGLVMAQLLWVYALLKQFKARLLSTLSIEYGDLKPSKQIRDIVCEYERFGTQTQVVKLPAVHTMRLGPAWCGSVLPETVSTVMDWKHKHQKGEVSSDDEDTDGGDGEY